MNNKVMYIFLDESGNLDFSKNGSRYFILTALSLSRPFSHIVSLHELKYSFWEQGLKISEFHAVKDTNEVRAEFFKYIASNLDASVDTIIIDKPKTHPALQQDLPRFYQKLFFILLRYIFWRLNKDGIDKVIIVTDEIPLKKKRKEIEKAIKESLKQLRHFEITYDIWYFPSNADINLQIVDYVCWAIQRKWNRGEHYYYNLIKHIIVSEYDVFASSNILYY